QPLAQLSVAEEAAHHLRVRVRVPGLDEEAVDAVPDDLCNAARRRRQHGRPRGERLDDGVREVLPARREDRRVGGAEQLDDPLARQRTEEADALLQPELAHTSLERRALVALARDHERDAVDLRERLECDPERLLYG